MVHDTRYGDSGLDPVTRAALEKSFDVVIILNALQSVRVDASNLTSFEIRIQA